MGIMNFIPSQLLGAFALTSVASPPLFFLLILIHEGGHGLLLVPAMILGAPPFTNSLIILLILSIPLGNAAVGIVSWLAFKNANRYKKPQSFKAMTFFTLLFSLFLIAFDFFWVDLITSEDFALNLWQPLLGIPLYNNRPLQLIISSLSHICFPAYLIVKRSFDPQLVTGISAGTGAGTLLCINLVISPITRILRDNLLLLVAAGLPVFLFSVWVLHRLFRHRLDGDSDFRGIPADRSIWLSLALLIPGITRISIDQLLDARLEDRSLCLELARESRNA